MQELNLPTFVSGMPIVGTVPVWLPPASEPASAIGIYAAVFLFSGIVSIGRSGFLPVAAALTASFLVKSQIGLPALLGLLFAAVLAVILVKRASLNLVLSVVVAAVFIMFMKSAGPATGDLNIEIGAGRSIRAALAAGSPYSTALGLSAGAAIIFGLALWVSKFAVPLTLAGLGLRVVGTKADANGTVSLLGLGGATAALMALTTIIVVTPAAEVQQRFIETHRDIGHLMWNQRISFSNYLDFMFTEISIGAANSFAALVCTVFAGAGLVWLDKKASKPFIRVLARVSICAAWIAFVTSMAIQAGPSHWRQASQQKIVDSSAIEALTKIPVQKTITMTNELAYDRILVPYHPYLNPWAPALFGHQFWVADFMFDLHYDNIIPRFRAWKCFWNTPASQWHKELLLTEEIG
jgi:hypothetical protein